MSHKTQNDIKKFQTLLSTALSQQVPTWETINGFEEFSKKSSGTQGGVSRDTLRRWAGKAEDFRVPNPTTWNAFLETYGQILFDDSTAINNLWLQIRENKKELALYDDASFVNATYLFGIVESLSSLTHDYNNWHHICINGMGGLGKSSLSDALVTVCLEEGLFTEAQVIRAFAEQKTDTDTDTNNKSSNILFDKILKDLSVSLDLPNSIDSYSSDVRIRYICRALQSNPKIVIFDNLHSIADYSQIRRLISEFPYSTKTITTIRALPKVNELLGRSFALNELSLQDSCYLLLHEGLFQHENRVCEWMKNINIEELIRDLRNGANLQYFLQSSQSEISILGKTYDLVGGNPLALKLLVGQFAHHQPQEVLEDFSQAHRASNTSITMYKGIYSKVWAKLEPHEHDLLRLLSESPSKGISRDYLFEGMFIENYEEDLIREAIESLYSKNLLRSHSGNLGTYHYSIHQLTRTFVRSQITGLTKWLMS